MLRYINNNIHANKFHSLKCLRRWLCSVCKCERTIICIQSLFSAQLFILVLFLISIHASDKVVTRTQYAHAGYVILASSLLLSIVCESNTPRRPVNEEFIVSFPSKMMRPTILFIRQHQCCRSIEQTHCCRCHIRRYLFNGFVLSHGWNAFRVLLHHE